MLKKIDWNKTPSPLHAAELPLQKLARVIDSVGPAVNHNLRICSSARDAEEHIYLLREQGITAQQSELDTQLFLSTLGTTMPSIVSHLASLCTPMDRGVLGQQAAWALALLQPVMGEVVGLARHTAMGNHPSRTQALQVLQQLDKLLTHPLAAEELAAQVHEIDETLSHFQIQRRADRGVAPEVYARLNDYASAVDHGKLGRLVAEHLRLEPIARSRREDNLCYEATLGLVFSLPIESPLPSACCSSSTLRLMSYLLQRYLRHGTGDESYRNTLVECAQLFDQLWTDHLILEQLEFLYQGAEQTLRVKDATAVLADVWKRRIAALPDGASLLLPTGYVSNLVGHAMLCEITRTGMTYSMTLYNPGGMGVALLYHPSRFDLASYRRSQDFSRSIRLQPFRVEGISLVEMLGERGMKRLIRLLTLNLPQPVGCLGPASNQSTMLQHEKAVYQLLDPQHSDGPKGATRSGVIAGQRFVSRQKVDNCSWHAPEDFLKSKVPQEIYGQFKEYVERYMLEPWGYAHDFALTPEGEIYEQAVLKRALRVQERPLRENRASSRAVVQNYLPKIYGAAVRGHESQSHRYRQNAEQYIDTVLEPLDTLARQMPELAAYWIPFFETDLHHTQGRVQLTAVPRAAYETLASVLPPLGWQLAPATASANVADAVDVQVHLNSFNRSRRLWPVSRR